MELTLHTNKRHQTIDNFGASQAWWIDVVDKQFPESAMNRIADLLFSRENGIGLSCARFNIGAGSDWYDTEYIENWFMRSECFQRGPGAPYDWTCHKGQQRLLRLARDRGVERTIAFVNSPPPWMTVSGHTRGDETTGSTNLQHGKEREFGEFLAGILNHFAEIGMPFDYISPINEPQVPWDSPKQEGCRYSNQDMTTTILAVRAALDDAGIDTPILFNETNNLLALIDMDLLRPMLDQMDPDGTYLGHAFRHGGKYFEGIKDVFWNPAVRNVIAPIIAGHSYETDSPEALVPVRQMARATMDRYPGYDYWMTEYCVLGSYGPKRDLGIDPALYIANVIHHDLVELDAAAWQWWLGVGGSDYKDGLVYLDLDTKEVLESKMLWALGHWSRFLRPGSVRVELSGDREEGVLASGYLAADQTSVIVLVNLSNKTHDIAVSGAKTDGWRVYTTDAETSLAETGTVGGTVSLGPRSLITLVSDQAARTD